MPFDPCHPVRARLSDWSDGEPVPFFTGLMVRLHLTICPPCKRVSRSLAATREALRTLRDAEVDVDDKPDPSRSE